MGPDADVVAWSPDMNKLYGSIVHAYCRDVVTVARLYLGGCPRAATLAVDGWPPQLLSAVEEDTIPACVARGDTENVVNPFALCE